MLVSILDGYIDEPSSLGVPPFLSPIVRYMAGAILDSGHDLQYHTIDSYRTLTEVRRQVSTGDLLVMISGVSVPGKYARGTPMSTKEAVGISRSFPGPVALAGFMAWQEEVEDDKGGDPDLLLRKDADAQLFDGLKEDLGSLPKARSRTMAEWKRWAVLGAQMVEQHPDHPQPLIAEVDVYKGCPRFHGGGCSFCSEVLLGPPRFREPEHVASEVEALAKAGVTNFRLACSCIVSYKAKGLKEGRIAPSPPDVERLLAYVRKAAPDLKVLHVDNADPGVIARNPGPSERVLRSLVDHCTSGNILSLGMESADPAVIEANNLNSHPEEVLEAIRSINKVGAGRGPSGLPDLLPGLNFLAGLDGETSGTYSQNMEFLEKVLEEGLLLRRINIRQVLGHRRSFPGVRKRKDFMRFRSRVREEIDRPMLERLLPVGTVLRNLYTEYKEGNTTFARQVGTYPILVGIPGPVDVEGYFDVAIVAWGSRSVTAVPYPLDINKACMALLATLPGIGKKRAARLIRARPFDDMAQVPKALDRPELMEDIGRFITLG